MKSAQRIAVHGLFFASGAAGLLWQVTWVRGLSRTFGNTVTSAAVVAGVFVAALGVGALLGGRWADRTGARPLRGFAIAELSIAALGLCGALALPRIGPWTAALGGYVVDGSGWLHPAPLSRAAQALCALAIVGPAATLMGATLTLLVRHQVGADAGRSGLRVGLLYGVNTLGAALGALAADALLIPRLGQRGAMLCAAAIGATVGASAWVLRERSVPAAVAAPGGERAPIDPRVPAALLVGGFAALGFEILWLRFAGSALGAYRAVFSTLLAVHLCGLWLGATAAGLMARDAARARTLWMGTQAAVAVLALGPLLGWDPEHLVRQQLALRATLAGASETDALWSVTAMQLSLIAALVGPASVAMGAAFPLANAVAQRRGEVGRTAGVLYLATAAGNLAGSVAVGLWLIPRLGTQATAALLCAASIAAAALLARRLETLALPAAAAVAVVALWAGKPGDHLLWSAFPAGRIDRDRVLSVREGAEHTVVVTGRPQGPARLWTSGHPMTATTPHAQRYMRLMAHLPLLQMAAPERALVICFGVGNTVHAASLHPLARLEVADLDADVLSQAPHFTHANRNVLGDPRVQVIVDDGRHWLAGRPAETYDLVTLEPPPIGTASVGALYSIEFYGAVRRALRGGGAVSQWLPAYQVGQAQVRSLVAAFVEVFPDATLHVGDRRELILVGWKGAVPALDPDAIDRRLASRPAVHDDLRAHGAGQARQLVLTFGNDAAGLASVGRNARPLTDDLPALEYFKASHITETQLPAELLQLRRLTALCPACAGDTALDEALSVAARVYRDPVYQRFSNLVSPRALGSLHGALTEHQRAIVDRNATLRWLLSVEGTHARRR